jgi:hypothetical protein
MQIFPKEFFQKRGDFFSSELWGLWRGEMRKKNENIFLRGRGDLGEMGGFLCFG